MDTIHNPSEANNIPLTKTTDKVVSKSHLIKTADKILTADDPITFIKNAGIDLLDIYKELGNIALRADIMAKDRDGDVFVMGPDNRSRIMASTLILELAKHIKDKSVSTQVAIFNDPKLNEDIERVLAKRNKV